MAHNVAGKPTKLKDHKASRAVEIINYIRFHQKNRDKDLAEDPSK